MMIVHVEMYKFKHELSKMANMVKAKELLEALPEKVEWLQTMQVGLDFNHGAHSYDLCLYATFKTKEHLMWYKVEPESLEVLNFIKDNTEEMHVVDYEVDEEE
ncbi:Dabb family protein [Sulfurimonas diazotrophicus]|uniref:Dabb family protein n=1 Tax=Sulfurimonas diazotrophicus TaxID=3131939 RepID=A0ABZ3H6G8_9BACT